MDLIKLKKEAASLDPLLRIGKKGMTESIFVEIEKLLKKRSLIKIKILNNCPVEDIDAMVIFIVEKSRSVLVSRIGNIFSIYRQNGKKR
ncbi:MAG: YhbY family RNA-binding protein [archaeon]